MTDPVSRLGEIKARRDALTEKYGNVALPGVGPLIADVGWLLEHIEQLQRERDELNTLVSEMGEELTGRAAMAAELGRLRAQRQAALRICDEVWSDPFQCGRVRAALGADDDH